MTEITPRLGVDRRRRPTPALSRYTFRGGRRRGPRRIGDPQSVYVDRIGVGLTCVLAAIFLFQILDALLTLAHLARGGAELNPLMGYLIGQGPAQFLAVKLGTAGLGLLFLGLHGRFPLVRKAIAGLFILYAGVVCYHIVLFWQTGVSI